MREEVGSQRVVSGEQAKKAGEERRDYNSITSIKWIECESCAKRTSLAPE